MGKLEMPLNLKKIEMVHIPDCDYWGFRFKEKDITIKVNRVSFKEHEDKTCTMHVQYDIIEGEIPKDEKQFEIDVGDLVVGLIEEKIWYDEKRKQFKDTLDNKSNI